MERIILQIDYDRHTSLYFGQAVLSTHFLFNCGTCKTLSIDEFANVTPVDPLRSVSDVKSVILLHYRNLQIAREEVRTVTGKARDEDVEEEDEPPPVLPPSLPPAPASTRLHRRLFGGKAGPRHPSPRPQHEGYDSGHDSSSPRYERHSFFRWRFR